MNENAPPHWDTWPAEGSWPDGYGTYRYSGWVHRSGTGRSCGHYHRVRSRADQCSRRLARRLNKIAEQETGI